MDHKYEVALSFAGEDRAFAEAIARGLREADVEVFYDDFYTEHLWGEDLSQKLRDVYYAGSNYCLMILTKNYIEKMWTSFERQQAIERLIEQKGTGYILPVRLDGFDGDVPGLSNLIGYLSVSSDNPEKVVDTFLRKIGKKGSIEARKEISLTKPLIPKLKKSFTDKEKNEFLRKSFEEIIDFVEDFATATERKYSHFEFDLERITSKKIICTLYDSGKEMTRFKIWIGGMLGSDSICLLHGSHVDIESDNSYNEAISLEEFEGEIKLKPMGFGVYGADRDNLMSPREVAEYLWEMVCERF